MKPRIRRVLGYWQCSGGGVTWNDLHDPESAYWGWKRVYAWRIAAGVRP